MQKEHLIHLTLGIALTSIPLTTSALERCETPIEPECVHAEHRPIENVHFAYGATEDGEAWVARYDHRSSEPTWRTSIGGDGQQTVEAVALAKENRELLVVGGSTSTKLEGIGGSNNGGRDGYVLRLNVESGEVQAGTFVGGEGEELLTGVAEGTDGHILVAGQSSDQLEDFGDPPAKLVRVLSSSVDIGEDGTMYVFYEKVSPTPKDEKSRFTLGRPPVEKPRLWVGCDGDPRIGVPIQPLSSTCWGDPPPIVYRQDQIDGNYTDDMEPGSYLGFPPGGFGFHALRWKQYHASASSVPPYDLDLSRVPVGTAVPKGTNPVCADASTLDFLETQLFFKGGIASDPPGGWSCGSHANLSQLSLFSAFLHSRWGTPVYTHFGYWETLYIPPGSPPLWYTNPVAIEETVFEPYCFPGHSAAYGGEKLEDLCNLTVPDVNALTCTTSGGIPGVAGNGRYLLKLKHFMGSTWKKFLVFGIRGDSWEADRNAFGSKWYEPGEYIMDPPDGSESELAILEAASHQLSNLVFRDGIAHLTYLEDGAEICTDEMKGLLPASE